MNQLEYPHKSPHNLYHGSRMIETSMSSLIPDNVEYLMAVARMTIHLPSNKSREPFSRPPPDPFPEPQNLDIAQRPN